jgi:hypothetical protein
VVRVLDTAAQLEAGHQAAIAEAPISLTLLKQTRGRAGGGLSAWSAPVALGPYTCRVHRAGAGRRDVRDEHGQQNRNIGWGILLPPGPPLDPYTDDSPLSRIEFVHPVLGRMRITRLDVNQHGGHVWGWQGELERIA